MSYRFGLIFMALGAFSLSACDSLSGQKETIDWQQGSGDVMTPPPVSPNNAVTFGVSNNDSSVDIFDLSGEVPVAGASFYNNPTYQDGGIATNDSSVTVYPVDGDSGMVQSYDAYNSPSMPMGGGFENYGGAADNQIFFKHGSARLGSGDIAKLTHIADKARFAPVSRITVEGFASRPTQAGAQTVEGSILNLKESMNRSFAVSKNLMEQGVPAEKLKTVSWGAAKASGNDSQDRRADVTMGER